MRTDMDILGLTSGMHIPGSNIKIHFYFLPLESVAQLGICRGFGGPREGGLASLRGPGYMVVEYMYIFFLTLL